VQGGTSSGLLLFSHMFVLAKLQAALKSVFTAKQNANSIFAVFFSH
jgi:hypothetical protein